MATPTAIAAAGVAAGKFQDSQGNVLKNGSLTFDLSQSAAATGGGEVIPRRTTVTLDVNGVPSSGQVIWRNTDLSPSGTTYRMQAFDSGGNFGGDFGSVIISGASPIDLTIIVPVIVNGSVVSLSGVVLTAPTAQQTINAFPLVMEGTTLGFSAASSTTEDTGLSRSAAAVVAIGNGTQGDTTGSIALGGATPAASGAVRVPNNSNAVVGRNAANSADVTMLSIGSANTIVLGGFAANQVIGANGALQLGNAGSFGDTGLSRTAAGAVSVGNGTFGDTSGVLNAATVTQSGDAVRLNSSGIGVANNKVVDWSSTAGSGGSADTGLSRTAAGVVAVGNGTQGDTTGNFQLNSITKYLGVATVAAGVASIVTLVNSTGNQANIGSTLLYAVPASGGGMYRVTYYLVVTQAATTSSTLPQLNAVYTDFDTNVSSTIALSVSSSGNTVGTTNSAAAGSVGSSTIYAHASSNINYTTTLYASVGATPMQYAARIKLEYLGN